MSKRIERIIIGVTVASAIVFLVLNRHAIMEFWGYG